MRILGMGVPEMTIMLLVVLVPAVLAVALIVALVKRANGRQQPLPDERQRASALAYQRLS